MAALLSLAWKFPAADDPGSGVAARQRAQAELFSM
jgi:hypothetical protein